MKTKSVLSWFGSDASVAASLGALLDDCNHVTIPFAGGMSILPHLKAKAIVANDLHCHAVNFYHVLSGEFGDDPRDYLISRASKTLSHPAELHRAEQALEFDEVEDKAWAFWAQCWIGRKGKGGTKNQGGKPSVRRTANGGNNATRIKSAAADLEAWAEEFRRCEFTCEDYAKAIFSVAENPKCGIYCDPPWYGAGDSYLHSFADYDHGQLCGLMMLNKVNPIVIRYGDDPRVRELYEKRHGWTITEATSRTQANKKIGEIWITKNVDPSQLPTEESQ